MARELCIVCKKNEVAKSIHRLSVYCKKCFKETYKKELQEDRREKKIERMKKKGTYQNNPDYTMQYQPKGNVMVVGIRNKPVMYSQLTPEEKKIYHDKEMEKRKKNGKRSIWDYLDLR